MPAVSSSKKLDPSRFIVQKYGGSSVATPEKIRGIAERVGKRIGEAKGNKLVIVVSAMGKTTDGLIALANEVADAPPAREMDMLLATGEQVTAALLSIALNAAGTPAMSMNAFQLNIVTTRNYNNARIRDMNLERLRTAFETHDAVVVTGFQGITELGDLTTLGRGGSDTSAVAIAAKARCVCEIYSDVAGVFAVDPWVVPGARHLDAITYDEMLELAASGAKVLHSRAVELAKVYGVKLYCASTFSDERGTYVMDSPPASKHTPKRGGESLPEWLEHPVVTGVTSSANQMKFSLRRVPGNGGTMARLFHSLAKGGVNLDMISTASDGDRFFLTFSTVGSNRRTVIDTVEGCLAGEHGWEMDEPVEAAKISAVGVGMNSASGVAARFFEALHAEGLEILGTTTSEIKISVLVSPAHEIHAVQALAREFRLAG
jgi:aspartate kinase